MTCEFQRQSNKLNQRTVSKWEAGTNYPEMDKLLQLCDLFHTSLDDLMRGSV
ncbi:MAG: helix-turn-helix transcriptional regulator, partial [Eggerthella sp.]